MDQATQDQINGAIKRMAENALRTICLAYRDFSENEDVKTKDAMGVY